MLPVPGPNFNPSWYTDYTNRNGSETGISMTVSKTIWNASDPFQSVESVNTDSR